VDAGACGTGLETGVVVGAGEELVGCPPLAVLLAVAVLADAVLAVVVLVVPLSQARQQLKAMPASTAIFPAVFIFPSFM
jgi:hypothetical protein